MPCLYGITLAVSDMARSVLPWNAWSNVTTAALPAPLRAIFPAFSPASAPEFANIVRLSKSPGAKAFSRSASSMYGSFAVTWKQVWVSSSSCFWAAATTSGGVWPTFRTEIPVAKSISRLPSTSSMIEPDARAVTIGWTLNTAWGMAAFRRSNHSRDFGPGISVTTFRSCGMSIVLPSGRGCRSSVTRRAGGAGSRPAAGEPRSRVAGWSPNRDFRHTWGPSAGPARGRPRPKEAQMATALKAWKLFIGGAWVDPAAGETEQDIDPATTDPVAEVAVASEEDVEGAVKAAKKA